MRQLDSDDMDASDNDVDLWTGQLAAGDKPPMAVLASF